MIREYNPKEDYEAVAELWRRCFSGTLRPIDSEAHLRRVSGHAPQLFLVYEEGGEIVGSVFAGYDGRQATVHRLGVLPEHRGKGMGKALMNELMARLEKMAPIEVITHADPEGHVVRLYEDMGLKRGTSFYMKKKLY